MAQFGALPRGIRAFEAGRQSSMQDDAMQAQQFGQVLGQAGQLMQIQDMARKRQEDEQLRTLFRESGGDLTTMRDSAFKSGMYKQGLELDKTLREQKKQDLEATEKLLKVDEAKRKKIADQNDLVGGAYEHAFGVYDQLIKGKVPEPMARAEAQKAWEGARMGLLSNPVLQGVQVSDVFDPDQARTVLSQTKRMKGILDEAYRRATLDETKRAAGVRETETARHNRVSEGNAAAGLGVQQQRLGLERERFLRENDPSYQERLAGAKAAGKEFGEARAQAQITLPQAVATAERGLRLIDELVKHPGFQGAVGATYAPGARFVPGTDAADFQARFDEIKGGSFLQVFETLKGGGQITEMEGRKATEAINRMSLAQSEKEFKAAATELQTVMRNGMRRAQTKAGQAPSGGAGGDWTGGGELPPMDAIDAELRRRGAR